MNGFFYSALNQQSSWEMSDFFMLRLICICPEMWGEFFLEKFFQGIIPFILR